MENRFPHRPGFLLAGCKNQWVPPKTTEVQGGMERGGTRWMRGEPIRETGNNMPLGSIRKAPTVERRDKVRNRPLHVKCSTLQKYKS